jgi:hypothetical protein
MAAAVTAKLAALSRTRRGLRVTRRVPSSSGTGSQAENLISQAACHALISRVIADPEVTSCGGTGRPPARH